MKSSRRNFIKKTVLGAGAVTSGLLPALSLTGISCSNKKGCSTNPFYNMDKIDAHCHIEVKTQVFMGEAKKENFRILTINTDAPLDEDIYEQQEVANYHQNISPGQLSYLATFSMDGWGSDEWLGKTIAYIEESLQRGALGVKVWKNIGMEERAEDGSFIMIDDPGFDPLFDYLEKKNIPVCGHLGEPRNCWLPIEEMTVNNDKEYYNQYPQYHMYLHPEYPSYEEQLKARDHMLEKHPNLKFMGAHFASLEWDVDKVAGFLDRFPNATVDTSARMCHLQFQAQQDNGKIRAFMIKYQDRIIYGTDMVITKEAEEDPAALVNKARQKWANDWKFLSTNKKMSTDEVNGDFKGLKLPQEVLNKIYRLNVEKMFPGI